MYFYDIQQGAFFVEGIHSIPTGAIAVSEEDYQQLIDGRASGQEIIVKNGELALTSLRPSAYHQWQKNQWVLTEEKQAEQLADKRHILMQMLTDKTDQLKAQILAGYSQAEIESFYRQEREAREWLVDHNAPTPMLSQIAASRSEVPSLAVLVEKVIEKADAFSAVVGAIIGKKQAIEIRIEFAKNNEDLTACEQEINEWQLANH